MNDLGDPEMSLKIISKKLVCFLLIIKVFHLNCLFSIFLDYPYNNNVEV